ncbi:DUF4255 domain-containing protein [Amycolatopsis mongoliensis]|uniref:DUF4255 domain-containing protein n=1 Tax=Amycolatopsis mongoliensis TaxID=715475 RepID=A0A9Y2JKP5_9PSEU|nr:DUF4255 domain-containing protein [Amycolatopsis sp. 4-36]WIX99166.1 DUF4255 domain-containing protein [Amycolatopsis sp. 4-36]
MSNYLAVAQATEALRLFLARRVQADVPFAVQVLAQKPFTEPPAEPTITVFLYEVVPNASARNLDAPTRSADGTLLTRPQAAIDLHYLISFYGHDTELQPQKLLGSVVRHLHTDAALLTEDLEAAAASPALLGGDLAASPQRVRLTPTKLDVDDLYKLWTMLIQVPYALSVLYAGTLVLLDGDGVPAAGKPVLRRNVRAVAGGRPVLDRVLSRPGGSTTPPQEGPVPRGFDVVLKGDQLGGDGVTVELGDLLVTPSEVREDTVVFRFPEDPPDRELPPGIHPVAVVQDVTFPDGSTRRAFESNTVPVLRQPSVLDVAVADGVVTAGLDLPVRDDQRVVLLLDELDPPADRKAASYRFPAPVPLGPRPDERQVVVATTGVLPADYLVRVQVDGVRSRTADDLRTPSAHVGA